MTTMEKRYRVTYQNPKSGQHSLSLGLFPPFSMPSLSVEGHGAGFFLLLTIGSLGILRKPQGNRWSDDHLVFITNFTERYVDPEKENSVSDFILTASHHTLELSQQLQPLLPF